MNIALSAVIISILLIPPVVFYLSLYVGRYARAIPKFSLFEGILGTAVISLLIHGIAILCISNDIRFDILIKVLGGDLKNVETGLKNPVLKNAVIDFAFYNCILLFVMAALGRITRAILLRTGLHERNQLFNLYHQWWYFFNGAFADIDKFDLVFVDAMIDTKDGTVIYSGFLVNFETNGRELDRIYLKDVIQREFKKYSGDETPQLNEPVESLSIPTGTFSLKYSNLINLSVNFIVLENAGEDDDDSSEDDILVI